MDYRTYKLQQTQELNKDIPDTFSDNAFIHEPSNLFQYIDQRIAEKQNEYDTFMQAEQEKAIK